MFSNSLRILGVLLGLWSGTAGAGTLLLLGAGTGTLGPPPAYVGPGDVVSGAIMWWGTRCYTAAYSGNVVDIVDGATGNTTGTRLQCSSGNLVEVVSSSACTFVTGNACSTTATTCASSCVIRTLYDQTTGNKCNAGASPCDVGQPTLAKMPTYTASCGTNSKPCGTYLRTSNQDLTPATNHVAVNQPFTLVAVASRTTAFTSFSVIFGDANANIVFTNVSATVGLTVPGNGPTASASNSALHSFIGTAPNSTATNAGSFAVDGVVATSTPNLTTAWAAGALWVGAQAITTNPLTGQILEVGVWPTTFSGTDITNMCHNQFLYWGTSTSC